MNSLSLIKGKLENNLMEQFVSLMRLSLERLLEKMEVGGRMFSCDQNSEH